MLEENGAGIDVAPGMIAEARRRCAGLPSVRLLMTSGRNLTAFADRAFDAVVAVDSFPYLYASGFEPVATHIHEAARVLREDPGPGDDLRRERGRWLDIPTHRVAGFVLYELPFGEGKPLLSGARPLIQTIAGGWELSVVYQRHSGQFLTPMWTGPDPTGTAFTTSGTPASTC